MKHAIAGMLLSIGLGAMLVVGATYQLSVEDANTCVTDTECELGIYTPDHEVN